ncbi:uncharacterized protein LOC122246414 isoform X2 [Penaeus japonicus]|uniref:uncharacterized protein LOC122246414 isoform X2 n=1 Tax=Penaeus japonicus TaxID=27405 RepID=UPI001C70DAC0|nr:uncharacterized protein LOC122246414 isoform X2 [Penaeus japonicus]XP_042861104.1 uncharacterized protein LOC122246414 isoform X2 [Penaeus japonicus]XP_042861181.1 uncharacterized protein LOC122246414 isoform X2 [Penaeus japonicus]XP_042861269.1 uncharacterized protein LOC122246414 isoform X2 [Penaeus japonicus]
MALYPSLPKDAPTPNYAKLAENPHSLLPACSVCLDEFCEKRPPKYLSCHHTFCEDCIHQLLRGGKVECPLCRKVTRVTSTTHLQTNNDVLTMAKYGDIVSSLWCHDCQSVPKSSCATHRVDNRSPASTVTLGQQLDSTLESWKPTFTRVVETAHGWSVVAIDTTYSTAVTISDMVTPLMTYIIDRLKCFMDS